MGPHIGGLAPLQRSHIESLRASHMPNRARRLGRLPDFAKQLPVSDLTQIAELIESCRDHSASVAELAGVTSKALNQCYGYEENEPHLGQCCELVQQALAQTESALATL